MNLFEIPEDPFRAEVRELYRLAWTGEVDLSQTWEIHKIQEQGKTIWLLKDKKDPANEERWWCISI